jgi:hypothetical protein
MNKEPQQNTLQPEKSGCLTIIVRLTWMAFGNLVLIIVAFLIAEQRAGIVLDIVFWAVVAGLILTRYIDINVFHGNTADNEPATLQHWRQYSILLIVIAALALIVAHVAGNVL